MGDIPPNKTIYCRNIYEKIRSPDKLRKCLYAIFSQFGKIVEIIVMRSQRLRGQAWVVFEEISAATAALRGLQGFAFFDKPLQLSYAKTKSDATLKLEGAWNEKVKEKRKEENKAAQEQYQNRAKAKAANPLAATGVSLGRTDADQQPANKILFVQNLPEASTTQMLSMLFQQFPGFKEVRLVEAKPGIAFVEYDNDMQASVALQGLQAFKISPTNAMQISYAKQ